MMINDAASSNVGDNEAKPRANAEKENLVESEPSISKAIEYLQNQVEGLQSSTESSK